MLEFANFILPTNITNSEVATTKGNRFVDLVSVSLFDIANILKVRSCNCKEWDTAVFSFV